VSSPHSQGSDSDTFRCVTHSDVWHDHMRYDWLIRMCNMTHPHVRHDSSTCATWLIRICDMTRAHMWDDSLDYMWYDSGVLHPERTCMKILYVIWFRCVASRESCRIHEWVMSHIRVSHVAYTSESCRVYEWDYTWYYLDVWHPARTWDHMHLLWVMSHLRMSHVAYTNESCRACGWVVSHMQMRHVTQMDESCYT